MRMSKLKRQHPAMIVFGALSSMASLALPIFFLVIVNYRVISQWIFPALPLFAGAVILLSLIYHLLNWFFYAYYYQAGYLHIKSGIIIKKERSLKRERVHTINIHRGILQRLFGLAALQIETAGERSQSEFNLVAVTLPEAKQIKASLQGSEQTETDYRERQAVDGEKVLRLSYRDLFLAGATSGSFLALFSILAVIASQLLPVLPDDIYSTVLQRILATQVGALAALLFFALLLSWLVSIVRFMVQYADFTIRRKENELELTWGLIVQKQMNLKLHRIQAVNVQESMLRQPFGLCSLSADVAGGGTGAQRFVAQLCPILKSRDLALFFQNMIPEYREQKSFTGLPSRALIRYLIRGALPIVLVIVPLQWVPYGWLSFILLPPALLWALIRYRSGGIALEDRQATFRYRFFTLHRAYMRQEHIQALEVSAGPVQRWRRLCTVTTSVLSSPAARNFSVMDLGLDDGRRLWDWYSHEK